MPLHELAFAEGEATFATFDNKLQRILCSWFRAS
jgi:hypothetical protein